MLPMPLIRPRRLSPGQTVGLVAPSSAPNEPEHIRFAIETLESLGFRVRPGAHVFARDGYFAGGDAGRADDLNAMFADDAVVDHTATHWGKGVVEELQHGRAEVMRAMKQ